MILARILPFFLTTFVRFTRFNWAVMLVIQKRVLATAAERFFLYRGVNKFF